MINVIPICLMEELTAVYTKTSLSKKIQKRSNMDQSIFIIYCVLLGFYIYFTGFIFCRSESARVAPLFTTFKHIQTSHYLFSENALS